MTEEIIEAPTHGDLYLKFPDEAAATATLYTLHPEVTDEDGTVTAEAYSTPNYANIDTLGTLYEAAPEDAGEDYVHAVLSGWHVNVRLVDEDPAPLEAFAVHPVLPRRVWA